MVKPGRSASLRAAAIVLLCGAALGLSLYHFVWSSWEAAAHGFADFDIFLHEVEQFLDTGVLYSHLDDPAGYAPAAAVYKFPPLYAMFLIPVVHDGYTNAAFFGHWLLQLTLYAAAVILLYMTLRDGQGAAFGFGLLLIALNFEPFFETLWRLQIETPLIFLLAACVWLLARRADLWAGVPLGLAVMLKLYPGLLLLYFLLRRRWAVVGGCLATMVTIQLAALAVIGWDQVNVFFFEVLPRMLGENAVASAENVAPARYAQSWLGLSADGAAQLARFVSLGLVGLAGWTVWRRREADADAATVRLELSLFVCVMLLAMPNSWVNYQLLLLLPILALWAEACRDHAARDRLLAALGVSLLLLLFYAPCAPLSKPFPCAQTPYLLGLVQLPRALHDRFVDARLLAALLPAALLVGRLWRPAGAGVSPAASSAAGSVAPPR